jgi:hypothetical protein
MGGKKVSKLWTLIIAAVFIGGALPSYSQKPITKPDLSIVDPGGIKNGKGGNEGAGNGSGGSALFGVGSKSGIGTGSGNGSGNGSGSGGLGLGNSSGAGNNQNNNDSDKNENTAGGKQFGNGSGNGIVPGGTVGVPQSTAEKLPYWYPMCLFIDDMHSQQKGNEAVKGLVQQAAKCKVALVVFPFTLKGNYDGDDERKINDSQKIMCNISGSGLAPAGSTSTCSHGEHADNKMCGDMGPPNNPWDDSIAGCGQLRAARGRTFEEDAGFKSLDKAKQDAIRKLAEKEPKASGGEADSIEDRDNCDAKTIGHEALGHGQFGYPNGTGSGNGIGLSIKGDSGPGWTDTEGCPAMVRNAFPNDGRWKYDPKRESYYTKPKDPSLYVDFNNPQPLFKNSSSVPLAGPVTTPPNNSQPPSQTVITVDDKPGKKSSTTPTSTASTADSGSTPDSTDAPPEDPRHKKKPGFIDSLLQSLKGGGQVTPKAIADTETLEGVSTRANPPANRGGASSSSITFDDNATKTKASLSPNGPNLRGGRDSVSGETGSFDSGFNGSDESSSQKAAQGISGGSTERSSTIGFDDGASKTKAGAGATGEMELGASSGFSTSIPGSRSGLTGVKSGSGSAAATMSEGFFGASDSNDESALQRNKKPNDRTNRAITSESESIRRKDRERGTR